jgi:hypothetical protein
MTTYAITGPPFNFLGILSETQRNAFTAWATAQLPKQAKIQQHHQVRAQVLRKTAGLLEQFYSKQTVPLANTFIKDSWKPGQYGHWPPAQRNDLAPAMTVQKIKEHLKYRLEAQDESVFHMNHLRNQIEKQEDLAQYANESTTDVPNLINRLISLFGQPEYQATLVRDITDTYKGQPRFRVHAFDPPTQWELEQHNHGGPNSTLILKG